MTDHPTRDDRSELKTTEPSDFHRPLHSDGPALERAEGSTETPSGSNRPRSLVLHPIGVIRTPFHRPEGVPIQPAYSRNVTGRVILDPHLEPGLADLEGFERIWLIYWLDRAKPYRLEVIPYRDTRPHGLFATRAPARPNPLGLSLVRLVGRDGSVLHIEEVDVLDGTPLLDIKPYVPAFDARPESAAGWFAAARGGRSHADGRFHR